MEDNLELYYSKEHLKKNCAYNKCNNEYITNKKKQRYCLISAKEMLKAQQNSYLMNNYMICILHKIYHNGRYRTSLILGEVLFIVD